MKVLKQKTLRESKEIFKAFGMGSPNEALIPTIVHILREPHSKKDRDEAIDELYRLAKIADNLTTTK